MEDKGGMFDKTDQGPATEKIKSPEIEPVNCFDDKCVEMNIIDYKTDQGAAKTSETKQVNYFEKLFTNENKGRFMTLFGVVWMSPDALLVKSIECKNPWLIIFLRVLFAGLGIAVPLSIYYHSSIFKELQKFKCVWKSVFFATIGQCFANFGFVLAMIYGEVATTFMIYASNTLIVGVLSHFIFHDYLSLWQIIFLLIGFSGVIVILSGDLTSGNWKGIVFASQMAIGMSMYWLGMRQACNQSENKINVNFINVFGLILSCVFSVFFVHDFSITSMDIFYLLIQGFVICPVFLGCFAYGCQYTHPAEISIIALLEIFLGPALVWIFLGDEPSHSVFIGGPILIFSIFAFIVFGFIQETKNETPSIENGLSPITIENAI